jgi:hypothetical protein
MSSPVSWQVTDPSNLGGSQSEEFGGGDSRYGIFQPGVKAVYPSAKKNVQCRFLPARDLSLSVNDAAFATSFVPYRDRAGGRIDEDTKSPAFTSWYTMIVEYTMIGNSRTSFLSPVTLQRLGVQNADVRDPLNIIRKYAKDNARWAHLLESKLGQGKQSTDLIPKMKFSALTNVLAFDDRNGQPEVALMKLSGTALKDMKSKLTAPRPAAQPPISDDEWANMFMLGDITSPLYGLMAVIQPTTLGTISTSAPHFSQSPFMLQGHRQYAIDPNTPFGQDVLTRRYNFFSDKVLKVLPFQELVEWVVADGAIPYDLIQEALGNVCALPPRPNNAPSAISQPGAAPSGGFAPSPTGGFGSSTPTMPAPGGFTPGAFTPPAGGGMWAGGAAFSPPPAAAQPTAPVIPPAPPVTPPPPPPPPAPVIPPAPPVTPPPPPPPTEPKFWVSNNGGVMSLTKSGVLDLLKQGWNGPVMAENQAGGWKTAADFGISIPTPVANVGTQQLVTQASQATVPTVPQFQQGPTVQPTVPTVPQFQQGPATPPTSTAVPTAGNPSKLSADKQARLDGYIAAISGGQTLAPDQLADYALLVRESQS